MFTNRLKADLYNGKVCFGTFIASSAPDTVEICGLLGYDFVVIDTEHGYMSPETIIPMIRAAETTGMTPLVRVTENSETIILRTLDSGAHGIHIPQVNTVEGALNAVKYSKYFPQGNRGVSYQRANGFGVYDLNEYMEKENDETFIVFHCESVECLKNIDEIAATDGLDCIIFGPYDMSQSMGIPGRVTEPIVEEAAQKMLKACQKHGKIPGIFTASAEAAEKRVKQGFRYMPVGVDGKMIADAYGNLLKGLRKIEY